MTTTKFLRSQAIEPTVRTFSSQGDISFEEGYLPIDWTEQERQFGFAI